MNTRDLSERRPDGGGIGGRKPLIEDEDAALVERSMTRARALIEDEPELRETLRSAEVAEALEACPTSIEVVVKAFELFADRALLRERKSEIAQDGPDAGKVRLLPEFESYTFAQIWQRVSAFASGLSHEGLVRPGSFVGICGFGSVDWVVTDLACLYLSAVSVPLQSSMSAAELQQIVLDAELGCIVCSREQVEVVLAILPQCPSVQSVIMMDVREGARAAGSMIVPAEVAPVTVRRMADLESIGRTRGIVPVVLPSARKEADPLMSLVYTSGSTGLPKGAMLTESLLRRWWGRGGWIPAADLVAILPQVTVSYMPLSHVAGRWNVMSSIAGGGVTGFIAKSDMSTLFEDIGLLRPTTMFLVPRIAEMIHQRYLAEVARRTKEDATSEERERIADAVMVEMRDTILGDRLLVAMIGSAPTPEVVLSFLKRCLQIPIFDGYGSTEAGGVTSDHRVQQGISFRLVDVPELGYTTNDKPYPRGELHVKTPMLVPGYYKNEQATKALFDDEGFMNTGDIVEQRGPDTLFWIDRAKNILKLSQGEFVATSRLEGLYASRSPFIHQIYLYGSGARAYLLAVVVPQFDAARAHLKSTGITADTNAIKNLLRSEFTRIAREEELHGYEVPRDFIIEEQPFTLERGLLTTTNKPARAKLKAYYGPALEALYAQLEQARLEELYGLREGHAEISTLDKVKKAISATVGLADADIDADQSFLQLGGDSLSAVDLERVLHDLCGAHIPVGSLLDPTRTVRALAEQIDRARGRRGAAITFEGVHGKGAKVVRTADLRIENFLGASLLSAAKERPRRDLPARARVALLTGANGFLGRFLALELLERLEGGAVRLFAMVRAPNDRTARERLVESYQTDPELAARFAKASENGRLVVLAGDLMKPRFGLTNAMYERVAAEVDVIVHNGALVNHALGYVQLFEPNVVGTARILELALTGQPKAIAYISTLGILRGVEGDHGMNEEDDVRTLFEERETEEGYAAGYSTTKWASEVLLRDAHEKFGVPVAVFRPSEIMAHSRYGGQVNIPDFFTRFVAGLVYTGIAPRTFYAEGTPDRAKHYDGLPVDVVAQAIAACSVEQHSTLAGYDTFHVDNAYYDDGISLDVIVAWIRSGGYLVERIDDYGAWYRAFRDRLKLLPDEKRQHSPLVILNAWSRPQAGDVRVDNHRLLARLRQIDATGGTLLARLPHISEALIHKYLDDLVQLGVIDPSAAAPTSAAG